MGKRSSSPRKCTDRLWGPPSLLFNRYRGSLPGVKRPGREVNHSLPSIAKVKNMNCAIPLFPLYALKALTAKVSAFLPLSCKQFSYKPKRITTLILFLTARMSIKLMNPLSVCTKGRQPPNSSTPYPLRADQERHTRDDFIQEQKWGKKQN